MKYIESEDINNSIHKIVDQIFDNLYYSIIVDKNGYISYINSSYAKFLGKKKNEIIGSKVEDIIPNTRLYETLNSGIASFDSLFTYENGASLVYTRMPIKNKYGEVIGVASISSLNSAGIVNSLYNKINSLEYTNRMISKQLQGLSNAPDVFSKIVGVSDKIIELKQTLSKVANTRMPLLITGESGTGKEVFATAIHNASNRKDSPFVKVNCAAIPQELLESELFGYESGTFSGAVKGGRAGKFELANNGTLLLDEIEELPLKMQSKLLRVLQEYEVERIGSVKPIPLNIQVICCSNKDLYQMAKDKLFREDLLFRINVMEVEIPPLRERMDDLPLLCGSIIEKMNAKYKLRISGISYDALHALRKYNWPGNVRELEHVLERACVLCKKNTLMEEDFQFLIKKRLSSQSSISIPTRQTTFSSGKEYTERQLIENALEECHGNKSAAAKLLGISRSLLYSKIKKYNI